MEEKKKDDTNLKDYKQISINDTTPVIAYKNELSKIKNTLKESEELLIDNNPISQYNFFVRNYNLSYNKIKNQEMKQVNSENNFKKIYWIQTKWWIYVILNMLIPPIIVIINNFAFSLAAWGTIIVLYYVVVSSINIYSYYLWEEGRTVFLKNKILVPNPFERMVYNPTICKYSNVNNEHYEIDQECIVIITYSIGDA